jgi:hypothetical protein
MLLQNHLTKNSQMKLKIESTFLSLQISGGTLVQKAKNGN